MNYCIVRQGKGHLQPFVLWSLVLNPSTALPLQGHTLRHKAPVTRFTHDTSSASTVPTPSPAIPKEPHAAGRGQQKLIMFY